MFFGSNQKIRRLDRQSKFQRCTPFPAAMLEDQRSPPTWRLHTNYYFARNNSTNRSTLGQRTHLKLGKLSSLFIVYNITIFLLYPLNGFCFFFIIAWQRAHSITRWRHRTTGTRCWHDDANKENLHFDNKQLLDEVEHDILNYQNRGLCYRHEVLIIHDIMRKLNSIIVLLRAQEEPAT